MTRYDLVIVGAGIHGAGVAQAAAAAGHSVLILEKRGAAHGTSSRSSKLIHGGLRYLESGQFHLVRESLLERTLMLRNAPDLVHLVPFYIPVYRTTRRRPWQLRIGLSLYAALGGFGPGTSFGSVPKNQWDQLDGLDTNDLDAVLLYHDGQTDDAALTRAVVRSAVGLGAEVAVPADFIGAELEPDGAHISCAVDGQTLSCHARVLVNAAGPWATQVLERVSPRQQPAAVELVQGTHIAIPGNTHRGVYYVEAPQDGRAVFVMPWHGHTLVGTTETAFRGNPDDVHPLPEEVEYLTAIVRHYFPRYRREEPLGILESFAGLRVLPAATGGAFGRSRETLLEVDRADKPRVLTIYGGKLTGWRAAAEQTLQRLGSALPAARMRADTRELRLKPD
ncbi:MAG: FAD-dependent oxidoreductase [Steroidobacteraceae bacterium]